MNSSDNEVLIRILTAYERGGVEEARKELGTLDKDTEKQGQTTDSVHGKWRAWHHTIGGAASLAQGKLEGLGSALHGVSQLLGGMAGLGVGAVIAMGGTAIAQVIHHWTEAREKIAAAKQEAADYGLKVKQVAEEKALAEHIKEIEEISAKYNEAVAAADKLHKAEENLLEAKTKAKLAGIDAREEDALQQAHARGASPEEIAGIKRGYKQQRVDAEVEGANEKARGKVEDANTKITEAEGRKRAALEEQAAAAAEVEAQRQKKAAVDATLAKHGITDKDGSLSMDKAREKKIEELLAIAQKQEGYVDNIKSQGGVRGDSVLGYQLKEAEEKARAAREQIKALQELPEARKNVETAEAEQKRIQKETGKTIRDADVDQRAGEKDLKAANIELGTSVMSGTTKRSATERGNKEEEQHEAARAEAKRLKDEEDAVKAQLQRSKKELEGVDRGVHQGNKGIANIDQGLHQAGSSGDPTAALKQLHDATKSSDMAVRKYAEESLRLHEGTLNDMAALTAKVAALEKKRKTQADDIGGVAG